MSTEADERVSTILRDLVTEIERSVVPPEPRNLMSDALGGGADVYGLVPPPNGRRYSRQARKLVGAAAGAAVLVGMSLVGVSLLPSSGRLGQGSASAAVLLAGLAKTAAASEPLVRPPSGFFFTEERGGALVEGKGFEAMVDDTWETWYRPASSTATGLEVGAVSNPVFVSGHGKQAWVRAKEPRPNWVTNPRPGKPDRYRELVRVQLRVPSRLSLSGDRCRDLDERCVHPRLCHNARLLGRVPGRLAWGRCSPGCNRLCRDCAQKTSWPSSTSPGSCVPGASGSLASQQRITTLPWRSALADCYWTWSSTRPRLRLSATKRLSVIPARRRAISSSTRPPRR